MQVLPGHPQADLKRDCQSPWKYRKRDMDIHQSLSPDPYPGQQLATLEEARCRRAINWENS